MQNFASAGATVPQDGQRRSSPVPHDMQNRACGGFSVPQLSQTLPAIVNRSSTEQMPADRENDRDEWPPKADLCAIRHNEAASSPRGADPRELSALAGGAVQDLWRADPRMARRNDASQTLALLLAASRLLPVHARGTGQADSRVTMTPASGGVGTVVTLRGRGFGARDPVKVKAGFRILARTRTNRQRHRSPPVFTIFERQAEAAQDRDDQPLAPRGQLLPHCGRRRHGARRRARSRSAGRHASAGRRPRERRRATSACGARASGHVDESTSDSGARITLGRTGRSGGFTKRLTVPRFSAGAYAVKVTDRPDAARLLVRGD